MMTLRTPAVAAVRAADPGMIPRIAPARRAHSRTHAEIDEAAR
jgi:hypothetical protein